MNKYEVTSVDLYNGSFVAEVVEGNDVWEGMLNYFSDDEPELLDVLKKDIKENHSGGWYLKCEEETFIIKML